MPELLCSSKLQHYRFFKNGGRIQHLKFAEIMPSSVCFFVSGGKRVV